MDGVCETKKEGGARRRQARIQLMERERVRESKRESQRERESERERERVSRSVDGSDPHCGGAVLMVLASV